MSVSPAADGVAVGEDENVPSRDPSTGLRVDGATVPGEIGVDVRFGAYSSPSTFLRDAVGVGANDIATSDIPPVGVLVGDAVGSRTGIAVGLGVFFSPISSSGTESRIGAAEAVPPTVYLVGLVVGVMVALVEASTTVGLSVFHLPVVSGRDGGGAGPTTLPSS